MPIACTNCLRFHFGVCWEVQKQCYRCGALNHIERYCPQNRRIIQTPGEPLAGSYSWCRLHNLNNNPDMKVKVLNALKSEPGSPIWLYGRCIYRGYERHFGEDDYEYRGRPFQQSMDRRRSRSPGRAERGREQNMRYRSPIGRRSPSPGRRRYHGQERFESPDRRDDASRLRSQSPNPLRPVRDRSLRGRFDRPRSPTRNEEIHGSSAVVFQPRLQENNRPLPVAPTIRWSMPPKPVVLPQNPILQTKDNQPLGATRQPLGEVNSNTPKTGAPLEIPRETVRIRPSTSGPRPVTPSSEVEGEIDDPHFVLGIEKGALPSQIIDAYNQKLWEIDLETMAGSLPESTDGEPNIWAESRRLLAAAKKQLIGH